jgi:hypothetical protein
MLLSLNLCAQGSLTCGLTTRIKMEGFSKVIKVGIKEKSALESINKLLKTNTYLSKSFQEKEEKWIISLFSSGTSEDLHQQILESGTPLDCKHEFLSKVSGVKYRLYCLRLGEQYVYRLAFAEKDLTMTLCIDIVSPVKYQDALKLLNTAVSRISYVHK